MKKLIKKCFEEKTIEKYFMIFFEFFVVEIALSTASLMKSFSARSCLALENEHGEVGKITAFIP